MPKPETFVPFRVIVYETKDKPLGEGTLIGHVPLSELMTAEEYKNYIKNFMTAPLANFISDEEKRVLNEALDKEIEEEMQHFAKRTTPKIQLDNGKIVYGCEIWWEPIKEVKKNDAKK